MANFNLIEHKKRMGEQITPLDYQREIERLEMINKMLLDHNSKLTLQVNELLDNRPNLIKWFKNLFN